MTERKVLDGKPYAGNPHVRFDEGDVASATPRRGSLLYKKNAVVLVVLVTAFALSALSDSVLVRGRANERMWQTDYSPSQPLTWRWDGSDMAEITVTNHANGTVATSTVTRSGNENYGELALLSVNDSSGRMVDAIFDVGILLKKGETVSESLFARIARVTGAGCNAEPSVLKSRRSQWGFVRSASAVVPYDAGWHANSAVAEVMFDSDLVASGRSGYVPLPMPTGADGVASLSFDDELYAQNRLLRVVSGMFLILR